MSREPTLLVLGGSRLVLPIIRAAHELGSRVVTCDYLPDNAAHPHADEYRNVSIIDEDAVLKTAEELEASAITSFGTDPGVVSAAVVAEELRLPFQCSAETARILQHKGRFRRLLNEHNFPSPRAIVCSSREDLQQCHSRLTFPVIVKPTDASGSKGVSKVVEPHELPAAFDDALRYSKSRTVIVEEFIEKVGPQLVAEAFTVDGRLTMVAFMDQLFDVDGPNPYAPVGHVLPSEHSPTVLSRLREDLQRMSDLLGFRTGIYNVEARIAADGTPYILEVSPRGGGNRLAEFISKVTGTDLIKATVQATLGRSIDADWNQDIEGFWVQRMLFDRNGGIFKDMEVTDPPGGAVRDLTVWAAPGDQVEPFDHASFAFGTVWIQFTDRDDAQRFLADPSQSLRTVLEPRLAGDEAAVRTGP